MWLGGFSGPIDVYTYITKGLQNMTDWKKVLDGENAHILYLGPAFTPGIECSGYFLKVHLWGWYPLQNQVLPSMGPSGKDTPVTKEVTLNLLLSDWIMFY